MVSMLALIGVFMIAVVLTAMLLAGGGKARRPWTRHAPSPFDGDVIPHRSHAEASRRSGGS